MIYKTFAGFMVRRHTVYGWMDLVHHDEPGDPFLGGAVTLYLGHQQEFYEDMGAVMKVFRFIRRHEPTADPMEVMRELVGDDLMPQWETKLQRFWLHIICGDE